MAAKIAYIILNAYSLSSVLGVTQRVGAMCSLLAVSIRHLRSFDTIRQKLSPLIYMNDRLQ